MARDTAQRLTITATMLTTQPLHVGGLVESAEYDMPLALNGRGEVYVPGTSLAGPLRAWCEAHLGAGAAGDLFGFMVPGSDDKGTASEVEVEDVVVSAHAPEEIWDGVGIDREYGRAADQIKFDRVVLPRGTELELRIEARLRPDDRENKRTSLAAKRAALGHMARALGEGRIGLGAARTRGMGRLKLKPGTAVCIREAPWDQQGVLDWLRFRAAAVGAAATAAAGAGREVRPEELTAAAAVEPRPWRGIRVEIEWRGDGPVMVKSPAEGITVDALPMVSADGSDQLAMVLPGAGIKGVLRAQAERIVRTVCGLTAADWGGPGEDRHLKQLAVPLVEEMFGLNKRPKDDRCDPPGKARLWCDPCYAGGLGRQGADRWRALATGVGHQTDGSAALQQAFHAAVDRWTGGAADQLLFSGAEPLGIPWEPIRLELDLSTRGTGEIGAESCAKKDSESGSRSGNGPGDKEKAMVALLVLLLRDLMRHRVTLGYGGTRGYGSVAVDRITITPDNVGWLTDPLTMTPADGAPPAAVTQAVAQAWRSFCEAAAKAPEPPKAAEAARKSAQAEESP